MRSNSLEPGRSPEALARPRQQRGSAKPVWCGHRRSSERIAWISGGEGRAITAEAVKAKHCLRKGGGWRQWAGRRPRVDRPRYGRILSHGWTKRFQEGENETNKSEAVPPGASPDSDSEFVIIKLKVEGKNTSTNSSPLWPSTGTL